MDILTDILQKSVLESHLPEFIEILRQEPHEYWREEHFGSELPGKFELSIVALTEGHVAGYIIASLKGNNPYIHKFMVRKDLRDKKAGTEMLDRFERNLRDKGYNSVDLTVREDNPKAIRFYERNTFRIKGKRTDSKDGSILIIMKKELV